MKKLQNAYLAEEKKESQINWVIWSVKQLCHFKAISSKKWYIRTLERT